MFLIKFTALLYLVRSFSMPLYGIETQAYALCAKQKLLAVAYDNRSIVLYDIDTAKVLQKTTGHKGSIETVSFDQDCSKIISGGWDNRAVIWDLKRKKSLAIRDFDDAIMYAAFTENSEDVFLIEDDHYPALFNADLTDILNIYKPLREPKVSNGKKFLVGQKSANGVSVVRIDPKQDWFEFAVDFYITDSYFSSDDTTLVVQDGSIFYIWDLVSKKHLYTIISSIYVQVAALNTPKGELYMAGKDTLEVWEYAKKILKYRIKLHELSIEEITNLSFSKDGKLLAVTFVSKDKEAKVVVIDTEKPHMLCVITALSKYAKGSEFIDGDRLLIYSNYPMEIWNIKKVKRVSTFY